MKNDIGLYLVNNSGRQEPCEVSNSNNLSICKRYDKDITQRKISQAAGVTVVTLRHNLNTVLKSANINTKGMENLGIISIIVSFAKIIFFKTN